MWRSATDGLGALTHKISRCAALIHFNALGLQRSTCCTSASPSARYICRLWFAASQMKLLAGGSPYSPRELQQEVCHVHRAAERPQPAAATRHKTCSTLHIDARGGSAFHIAAPTPLSAPPRSDCSHSFIRPHDLSLVVSGRIPFVRCT